MIAVRGLTVAPDGQRLDFLKNVRKQFDSLTGTVYCVDLNLKYAKNMQDKGIEIEEIYKLTGSL